ncbi:MAG: DUF432 domain-containing protein [Candidatus Nitrosocaldus sp.]
MVVWSVLQESLAYGEYTIEGEEWKNRVVDKILLSIKRVEHGKYVYERYEGDKRVASKFIDTSVSDALHLCIYPVMAIYTPQPANYAKHLLLKFKDPLVMDTKSSLECYIKIPVEVGIFEMYDGRTTMIDVFATKLIKYALYGMPENGVICRYRESTVYFNMPRAEPFAEAVAHVRLHNYLDRIVTVSMLVIPIEGIDLYYSGTEAMLDTVSTIIRQGVRNEVVDVKVEEGSESGWSKTRVNPTVVTRSYTMELGF